MYKVSTEQGDRDLFDYNQAVGWARYMAEIRGAQRVTISYESGFTGQLVTLKYVNWYGKGQFRMAGAL